MGPLSKLIFTTRLALHGRRARRNQWLPPEVIRARQARDLRAMVRFAAVRVPMYRERYREAGIDPREIRGLDDLPRLPLVTKQDLIAAWPDGLLPEGMDPDASMVLGTSGSTGRPVHIYLDVARSLPSLALLSRVADAAGVRLGRDRIANVVDIEGSRVAVERKLSEYLPALIGHRTTIPSSLALDVVAERLEAFRPDVVMSYAGVLRGLAALKAEGAMPSVRPRVLGSTGEVLDDGTRRFIEEGLGCKVFDGYASTEGGNLAFECHLHRGLHVNSDVNWVEILGTDGAPCAPGVPGTVVVTRLLAAGTPIIRYAGTGDVATMLAEPCPCGRSLPRLGRVEGRRADQVRLPDGRVFHAFSFTDPVQGVLVSLPALRIRQFQIVQESLQLIRLLLVEGSDRAPSFEEIAARLRRAYEPLVGSSVEVRVERVEEIPRSDRSSSPAPVVVSRLDAGRQPGP